MGEKGSKEERKSMRGGGEQQTVWDAYNKQGGQDERPRTLSSNIQERENQQRKRNKTARKQKKMPRE